MDDSFGRRMLEARTAVRGLAECPEIAESGWNPAADMSFWTLLDQIEAAGREKDAHRAAWLAMFTQVNDLGYIIRHEFWGRSHGTEAASAVRDYAFSALGLDSLHANMPHDHEASRRVAEKIGMSKVREFDNPRNRGIRTFLYALRRS